MYYAGLKYGLVIQNIVIVDIIVVVKYIIIYGIHMQKKQIIILKFIKLLIIKNEHLFKMVFKHVIFSLTKQLYIFVYLIKLAYSSIFKIQKKIIENFFFLFF